MWFSVRPLILSPIRNTSIHEVNRQAVRKITNWLNGEAQIAVVSGINSSAVQK